MRRWALVVVGLYLAALLALTWPVTYALMTKWFAGQKHDASARDVMDIFAQRSYWALLGVMAASQAALLIVPVRAERQRPVARWPLVFTVAASGLMAGVLLFCASLSYSAFVAQDDGLEYGSYIGLGLGVLTWAAWSIVFYRMGRRTDPRDFITRLCRRLFQGSILELLVAVPTHVWVRQRDYCCAGFATFFGIAMGIAVMLLSFGPAVFFLFAARWQRLHPQGEPRKIP